MDSPQFPELHSFSSWSRPTQPVFPKHCRNRSTVPVPQFVLQVPHSVHWDQTWRISLAGQRHSLLCINGEAQFPLHDLWLVWNWGEFFLQSHSPQGSHELQFESIGSSAFKSVVYLYKWYQIFGRYWEKWDMAYLIHNCGIHYARIIIYVIKLFSLLQGSYLW